MEYMVGKNSTEFSILIHAYNEAGNIVFTIQETVKVLEGFNPNYEILIIDDGSVDNTYRNVIEFLSSNNSKVKIEKYTPNMGKGFALKYGIDFLRGKYVLFLDADLDLHPSHLIDLFKIMQKKNADVVIGSKMHKDSVLNYPKIRRILSSSYYFIVRFLFRLPVKDTQTGIKLFRYEVLKDCISRILIKRYAFDLELLITAHRKGFKIVEAPIKLKTKRASGRIGLKDAFWVLIDTFGIFLRFYIKKYYN